MMFRVASLKFGLTVLMLAGVTAILVRPLMHETMAPSLPRYSQVGLHASVAAKIRDAEDDLREAPDQADRWGELGMVFLAHQMDRQAAHCLVIAGRLAPLDPRWSYLSGIANSASDLGRAREAFLRTIALRPADVPALMRLARLDFDAGDTRQAQRRVDQVLAIDEHHVEAWVLAARLKLREGKAGMALADAEHAISLSPQRRDIVELLARANAILGRHAEADRLRVAAERLPGAPPMDDHWLTPVWDRRADPAAEVARARELAAMGLLVPAMAKLTKLAEDPSIGVETQLSIARTVAEIGDSAAALAILESIRARSPDDIRPLLEAGLIGYQTGQWEEARRNFQAAVEIDETNFEARFNLGLTLARLKDHSAALAALDRAAELRPESAPAHAGAGLALIELQRFDEARDRIHRALLIDPDDAYARELLELATP